MNNACAPARAAAAAQAAGTPITAIAQRYAKEGATLFLTATQQALLEETRALAAAHGAKVTLHAPEGVELLSAREIMLPLNNLWGATAEAEFEFNADFYPSAKLEMLVEAQLEGRHSYGTIKVVMTRRG